MDGNVASFSSNAAIGTVATRSKADGSLSVAGVVNANMKVAPVLGLHNTNIFRSKEPFCSTFFASSDTFNNSDLDIANFNSSLNNIVSGTSNHLEGVKDFASRVGINHLVPSPASRINLIDQFLGWAFGPSKHGCWSKGFVGAAEQALLFASIVVSASVGDKAEFGCHENNDRVAVHFISELVSRASSTIAEFASHRGVGDLRKRIRALAKG